MPVDHDLAFADAEQISERPPLVAQVAFVFGDALAFVFQQTSAFGDRLQGKAAGSVDVGRANDQTRKDGEFSRVCSIAQLQEAAVSAAEDRFGGP